MESLSEATSGAVGALVSTTILYPLDTCKTKYQAEVQAQGHQKYRSGPSHPPVWVPLHFLRSHLLFFHYQIHAHLTLFCLVDVSCMCFFFFFFNFILWTFISFLVGSLDWPIFFGLINLGWNVELQFGCEKKIMDHQFDFILFCLSVFEVNFSFLNHWIYVCWLLCCWVIYVNLEQVYGY